MIRCFLSLLCAKPINGGGNLDKIEVLRGSVNYQGTPFLGEPFIVSADKELVIEAEYFDTGGREITFHDTETGGGNTDSDALRGELGDGSENVRMERRNPEGGDNITIGWAEYGEWIAYTLNVEDKGYYDVSYVIATNSAVRKQHVEIDNDVYPEVEVRTIGDWTVWGEFSIADVKLTAGKHVLYAYYYGNFDKIKIKKSTTGIQLPKTSLSGNVYAENGILKVKNFSATASLAVYNLLGQKITSYKSLNGDVEISLPTKGIYIVKAQDKGVTSSYKVVVK
ncbi:hypothetical protein FACS1894123_11650 [Bacteroidia bacterium]|nr:hypothetical protein FACS1894123_11650 [Bacteroidia bacterium]